MICRFSLHCESSTHRRPITGAVDVLSQALWNRQIIGAVERLQSSRPKKIRLEGRCFCLETLFLLCCSHVHSKAEKIEAVPILCFGTNIFLILLHCFLTWPCADSGDAGSRARKLLTVLTPLHTAMLNVTVLRVHLEAPSYGLLYNF